VVDNWLTDRSIETWIDSRPAGRSQSTAEFHRVSCSPVLFALTLAEALRELSDGVSYVDGCSSFTNQRSFQEKASDPLDQVQETLRRHGFKMDEDKTEVA